jgi:protein-tyrosine phosphatase
MAWRYWLRRLIWRGKSALGRFDDLKNICPERIKRFVFVCRGNVSRSPYAEAVAKAIGFPAISCGVDVSKSAPAEAMGARAALLRGKDISEHMSRSIFDVKIDRGDCLVAMDPSHLPISKDIASRLGCQLTLIGLWCRPIVHEIQDPYGGKLETYQHCYDKIDEAVKNLVSSVKSSRGNG